MKERQPELMLYLFNEVLLLAVIISDSLEQLINGSADCDFEF